MASSPTSPSYGALADNPDTVLEVMPGGMRLGAGSVDLPENLEPCCTCRLCLGLSAGVLSFMAGASALYIEDEPSPLGISGAAIGLVLGFGLIVWSCKSRRAA